MTQDPNSLLSVAYANRDKRKQIRTVSPIFADSMQEADCCQNGAIARRNEGFIMK